MCDKVVNTHSSTIQFVSKCYKTQKICEKALNESFLNITDRYETQKMFDRIISDDHFSIRYVPDQHNTQQMCDKAVDDCLAPLKFVPDWFITSKMVKILFTALYADENILYFSEYSGNVVFICNEMGILNIDLNNINLDDTNYEEDDPILLFLSDFWLGMLNLKNARHLKKNKMKN